jgi:hypothetical protein
MQQVDPGKPTIPNALRTLFAEHRGKVSDKWSTYLEIYERLFKTFRNKPVRLLEIGVQNGGSLEIWRKYFPTSRVIVGCDINPDCSRLRFVDDAIKLVIGDINSDEVHSKIVTCSAEYDIIIDDADHRSSDIVRSFAQYFGNLAEGGLYIVEDLHCSYWRSFEGGLYDPYSSMSFFKRLLDVINKEHWRLPRDRAEALAAFSRKYSVAFDEAVLASIHSIEFSNSLVIVRKSAASENELGSREIAGCDALIFDVSRSLNDAASEAPDETTNPWSLDSTPAEEEIEANRKLVKSQELAIETLEGDLAATRGKAEANRKLVEGQELAIEMLEGDLAATREKARNLEGKVATLVEGLSLARMEQTRLRVALDALHDSTSWRIMSPVRVVIHSLKKLATRHVNKTDPAQAVRDIVITHGEKSVDAVADAGTVASVNPLQSAPTYFAEYTRQIFSISGRLGEENTEYVPKLAQNSDFSRLPLKVVAFYLPQFHPIPENDEWWGKGFTEWTNVSKAVPQFVGHYQPHLPGELGFYDLRLVDVMRQQVDLARHYGVGGFCFHHYWFGGRRLLERPVEQFLEAKDIDFPFCLCWANENWTRRWDGEEKDILIAQQHSTQGDFAFIDDVLHILRDERYMRFEGKPILLVYRVSLLPDAAATAARWRKRCIEAGIGEIYLVAVRSFEVTDPRPYGFDAAIEFPPHQVVFPPLNDHVVIVNPDYRGTIHDYRAMATYYAEQSVSGYPLIKTVMPGWDNEPRKPGAGQTFLGSSPRSYARWLRKAYAVTAAKLALDSAQPPFVFVNSWNEWAEGAHLEPDRKYGYAFLQATADVAREFMPLYPEAEGSGITEEPFKRSDTSPESGQIDGTLERTEGGAQSLPTYKAKRQRRGLNV